MFAKPVMKDFNILTNFKSTNSDLSLSDKVISNPGDNSGVVNLDSSSYYEPKSKHKVSWNLVMAHVYYFILMPLISFI